MSTDAARLLLFVASGTLAACATTGRAWVQEPEAGLGSASADRDHSYAQQLTDSEATTSEGPVAMSEDEARPRPRLDRVISLGDSASAPAERSAPAAAGAPPAAPVVVNIVNYGSGYAPSPVYYSGAPYYGTARASAPTLAPAAPSGRSGATPALGGDWHALPSYGPSFPYRTAPASPWERSR